MQIKEFFHSFLPPRVTIGIKEKILSGLAGGVATLMLAIALHLLFKQGYPILLLGSMAASSVLLFAAPHSPFSKPWNLIAGHLVSAIAGWMCSLLIADPSLSAGAAVGTAIFLMYLLNCLHPPGAATALTLVLGAEQFQHLGWHWVTLIVVANAGLSLLLALLINNLLPGRHYPAARAPQPANLETIIQPEPIDFEWAVSEMDSLIDVSLEDLTQIYALAQSRAKNRFISKLE
jgi:CBS-domain-containing membrane protein